jgi:hypothetical protein
MSLYSSTGAEILKTKRTASFWLSIAAAGLIPAIFFLAFVTKQERALKTLGAQPWGTYFLYGWQSLSSFLFPMFVILICTLIPQIEFKNNAWKQVYATPQKLGEIYFSKFITIHLVIFLFYILFNLFIIISGVLLDVINSKFLFLDTSINWQSLSKLSLKTYISILGISAIQYVLSLRFKNFVTPVGIGLALLVGSLIASGFGWEHIYKVPFAHPSLTLKSMMMKNRPFIENHEWNSIMFFVGFLLLGYLDLVTRKEKG